MVHSRGWSPAMAQLKRGQRGVKPKLDLSMYAVDDDVMLDGGATNEDVQDLSKGRLPRTRPRGKKTTPPSRFKSYSGPDASSPVKKSDIPKRNSSGMTAPTVLEEEDLSDENPEESTTNRQKQFSRANSSRTSLTKKRGGLKKSNSFNDSLHGSDKPSKTKTKKKLLPPGSRSPKKGNSPTASPREDDSADKYGYGDAAPDSGDKYGYGDAAPDSDNKYGYGDAAPDTDNKYGYGDAAPDSGNQYGYGDAAPDSDNKYGYGDAAPDSGAPDSPGTREKRADAARMAAGDAVKQTRLKMTRRNSAFQAAEMCQVRATKKAMRANAKEAAQASQLRSAKKALKESAGDAAVAGQSRTTKKNVKGAALAAAAKSGDSTSDKEIAIARAKEALQPEVRAKLDKIFDPSTPVRERIQTEIHLKKDKKLASLIADMKYLNQRQKKLRKIEKKEEDAKNLVTKNLETEKLRAKKEKSDLLRKKQEKIRAKKEAEQRQIEFEKNLKDKVASELAADYGKIREGAEEAKRLAILKAEEKAKQKENRKKYIKSDISGESNDVMRNLKEAWLESLMDEDDTEL